MNRRVPIALLLLLLLAVSAGAQEFLSAADAVSASAAASPARIPAGGRVTLEVTVEVADAWHIYGAKETLGIPTALEITESGALVPDGPARIPDGEPHEAFGETSYYLQGRAVLRQAFRVPAGTPLGDIVVKGTVSFQPCAEKACYEANPIPVTATFSVIEGEAPPKPDDAAAAPIRRGGGGGGGGLTGFLLLAVGAGLLALFMPCTYPMIPITISFFTKQGEARGGRVLPLALAYGVGIIGIFVLIGLIVGPAIITFATHPVTNLVIAVVFMVFALVLFGVWTLQPPQFLMNLAGKASSRGGFFGVFLMGATLVITSFTCTAPFVGSLLSLGATGGGLGRVALGMATFGATMAVPFVLLSLVPGALSAMPRSGEWMHTIKVYLGFVEIAAAFKFLSNADLAWRWNALPLELFLLLWTGIFAVAGLFLLGLIRLRGEAAEGVGPTRLVVGLATLLFACYCFYGSQGHRLDRVMVAIAPNYSGREASADGASGDSAAAEDSEATLGRPFVVDDHEAGLARARAEGKLLLVNFTGFT